MKIKRYWTKQPTHFLKFYITKNNFVIILSIYIKSSQKQQILILFKNLKNN